MNDHEAEEPGPSSALMLRRLCRNSRKSTLASLAHAHPQAPDGWPVASMVMCATDIAGSPIMLISELADHTRNISHDNRVSILFFAPSAKPLKADSGAKDASENAFAGSDTRGTMHQTMPIETDSARLTLFGRALRDDSALIRQRYLAEHPEAALYADFNDFHFYRLEINAAYWVGGFGKQRRLRGNQFQPHDCASLIETHDRIVNHMNEDHIPDLRNILLKTNSLASQQDLSAIKMVSIDCDGMLVSVNETESAPLRVEFPKPIWTVEEARQILVEMCRN